MTSTKCLCKFYAYFYIRNNFEFNDKIAINEVWRNYISTAQGEKYWLRYEVFIFSSYQICIIEVYFLKYYFESSYINDAIMYWQTIFNQLNIILSYVEIIGLCHSVEILWEIYVMRPKCHVRWLSFHFKRMLVTGLG